MSLRLSKTTLEQSQLPSSNSPPLPSTEHLDGVSYLFGHPISHSLSPLLHRTIYTHPAVNLNYAQFLYETKTLAACVPLMRDPKFYGASVTMPFKVSIIPHLDVLTDEAQAIGAVNTVFVLPDGPEGQRRLGGHNTDCVGIRESIVQNTTPDMVEAMKGRPGMVIGGGGTCRAAIYALKRFLGCSTVYLVNREKSEVDLVIAECKSKGFGQSLVWVETVAEAEALDPPAVVVSAIPDFPPKTSDELRARAVIRCVLGRGTGVLLEMCYSEGPDTAIAVMARQRNWFTVEGVEAMIWQGLEQDRIWLKREVDQLPVKEVTEVVRGQVRINVARARPQI